MSEHGSTVSLRSEELHRRLPDELVSPTWRRWSSEAVARAPEGWLEVVTELRELQEAVAATVPPAQVVAEAVGLLRDARRLLAAHEVPDEELVYGRMLDLASRGQTFSPPLWITRNDGQRFEATTRFGRFHEGMGGAVHGGAIAVVFDEALGYLADAGDRPPSRTVSLTVDYRSLTPMGTDLTIRGALEQVEGRKVHLRGTMHDGDRLCAEATALFVTLREGQP